MQCVSTRPDRTSYPTPTTQAPPAFFPGGGALATLPSCALAHNGGGVPLVSQPFSLLTYPTAGYFPLVLKNPIQWSKVSLTFCFASLLSCSFLAFNCPLVYSASISGSSRGMCINSTSRISGVRCASSKQDVANARVASQPLKWLYVPPAP